MLGLFLFTAFREENQAGCDPRAFESVCWSAPQDSGSRSTPKLVGRNPIIGAERLAYRMRENTSQMSKVPLVDRKETFGGDRLVEAVEHAFVKVSSLVVHPGHDGVCIPSARAQLRVFAPK